MKLLTLSLSALLATISLAADPMFIQQWGIQNSGQSIFRAEGEIRRESVIGVKGEDIAWPGLEAINQLPNDKEVVVAVIDSGLDMTHPEFEGRLYKGKDFL